MSGELAARVREFGSAVAQAQVIHALDRGMLSSDQGFDALARDFLAGMLDGIIERIEGLGLEAETATLRQIADDLAAPDAAPTGAKRPLA